MRNRAGEVAWDKAREKFRDLLMATLQLLYGQEFERAQVGQIMTTDYGFNADRICVWTEEAMLRQTRGEEHFSSYGRTAEVALTYEGHNGFRVLFSHGSERRTKSPSLDKLNAITFALHFTEMLTLADKTQNAREDEGRRQAQNARELAQAARDGEAELGFPMERYSGHKFDRPNHPFQEIRAWRSATTEELRFAVRVEAGKLSVDQIRRLKALLEEAN